MQSVDAAFLRMSPKIVLMTDLGERQVTVYYANSGPDKKLHKSTVTMHEASPTDTLFPAEVAMAAGITSSEELAKHKIVVGFETVSTHPDSILRVRPGQDVFLIPKHTARVVLYSEDTGRQYYILLDTFTGPGEPVYIVSGASPWRKSRNRRVWVQTALARNQRWRPRPHGHALAA